ncbi:hypothetical protein [Pedobacter gandavensis]|uniref:hypothetical protein n=1 Tax=Pedobacter gandavensis TaxID=2679963 RepID=UPI002930A808|nr:hypothetical protein [Pedobacter gandavensis]
MKLKSVADGILKQKKRPFGWLAEKMGRTFDGLKLSLTSQSIKYRDLTLLAEILEVSPMVFFNDTQAPLSEPTEKSIGGSINTEHQELKQALKSCKELNAALRDQLKDKDQIIALLSKH